MGVDSHREALAAQSPELRISVSAARKTMPGVEALRVAAAFTVLLQHCLLLTLSATVNGERQLAAVLAPASGIAVNVFFVISGLLLAPPLLDGRRFVPFLESRVLRLTPLYWLVGLYSLGLYVVCLHQAPVGAALSHFTYTSIYTGKFLVGSAWTLCVEFAFVFLLPSVCFLARRVQAGSARAAFLVATGCVAYIASRMVISHFHGDGSLKLAPLSGMLPLLLGAAVSELARSRKALLAPLQAKSGLSSLIACAAWFIAVEFASPVLSSVIISAASALAVAALMYRSPRIATFGAFTYGIYLWHLPILSTFLYVISSHLYNTYRPGLSWPAAVGVTIGVAVVTVFVSRISYFRCELPFIRTRRTHRSPRSGQRPESLEPTSSAVHAETAP